MQNEYKIQPEPYNALIFDLFEVLNYLESLGHEEIKKIILKWLKENKGDLINETIIHIDLDLAMLKNEKDIDAFGVLHNFLVLNCYREGSTIILWEINNKSF